MKLARITRPPAAFLQEEEEEYLNEMVEGIQTTNTVQQIETYGK
jgi:hypothetical protein